MIKEVRVLSVFKTIGTQYCEQWSKFGELEAVKKIVGIITVSNGVITVKEQFLIEDLSERVLWTSE